MRGEFKKHTSSSSSFVLFSFSFSIVFFPLFFFTPRVGKLTSQEIVIWRDLSSVSIAPSPVEASSPIVAAAAAAAAAAASVATAIPTAATAGEAAAAAAAASIPATATRVSPIAATVPEPTATAVV